MTAHGPEPGQVRHAKNLTRFAGFYSVVLMTLYNLAAAGLIDVPVNFLLKDKLHLAPTQQAIFFFLRDIPFFVGFAFGFLRDRWRPWGMGDRGYFAGVPILMALAYIAMAFCPATYGFLLAGMIVIAALSALLGAAAQGLLAAIANDLGMMGRLSVVTLVTIRGAAIYSSALGGFLGEKTKPAVPFVVSAAVCLAFLIMAFWRPKSLFRSGNEVFVTVIPEGALASIRRLLRHRAIYLPALVLFLWEFAPGWGTPLLFYLTNHVKLSESAFGASQGFLRLGTVLAALSYAWLCRRVRFKPRLNIGTFLGVLGGPLFLLIHTPLQANVVSFLAGVTCGLALTAYYDLLMRCCPKELEGVAFMLGASMAAFGGDISDIFGSYLYERGGFSLALVATTVATALIFVPIAFIPKSIARVEEGEPIVDYDAPVAA